MPAADLYSVNAALKELAKSFAKELTGFNQTITKLEQRVATLEKSQVPKS